jgi:formamidopyrimidine-DNA glycosylase
VPELPEVEIIARVLRAKIVGRKILSVQTDWPKYFRLPKSSAAFGDCAAGKRITAVDRRGKNILIHLTGGYLLLLHQKISGRLLVGNWRRVSPPDGGIGKPRWQPVPPSRGRFVHLVFDLDDGRQLGLSDLRNFGKALCARETVILNLPEIRNLGPEPLDPRFRFSCFQRLFTGRKGRIKQMLMNPNFIAGIGNIYSDEILYAAGIHPLTPLTHLRETELRALYGAMKRVLRKSIQLGGTGVESSNSPGAETGYDRVRMVYQRVVCPRGHGIERLKIGGRSAHFCPTEQRRF